MGILLTLLSYYLGKEAITQATLPQRPPAQRESPPQPTPPQTPPPQQHSPHETSYGDPGRQGEPDAAIPASDSSEFAPTKPKKFMFLADPRVVSLTGILSLIVSIIAAVTPD